ncbi:peptide-methionine (S)-S-oxide reductase MsrA [Marinilactibacillus sp. Marseille-P9653]|uniref:peptide-methionine (S)-S-oxide reductase MsrA n=1 Tax=Marinilactibacillus sp. Marseille-P9653 TaxID=2866583 RepID=UPI001CE3BBAF|nr:peptide-methionine (S)-S-oxide reductase MsrA [Marinilactibacillus sp. Marseille-P9653]
MKITTNDLITTLYNLILNPATRDWERSLLSETKDRLDDGRSVESHLSQIEADLRPLALRSNLTPDVMDFYNLITGNLKTDTLFDIDKHTVDDKNNQDSAIFAGGCFWCMVEPFETREGILSVLSGYTGGNVDHPTYDQVSGDYTGHVEAVEIIFDTRMIQYADLVDLYWQLTDPTDAHGQFADRGERYRPIIFYRNEAQHKIATESKKRVIDSNKYTKPIVTAIEPASTFWPAENYHQQFYKKNRKRYKSMEQSRRQFLLFQRLRGKVHAKLNGFKK